MQGNGRVGGNINFIWKIILVLQNQKPAVLMQGTYPGSINVQWTQGEGVKLYRLLDHCHIPEGADPASDSHQVL